MSRRAEPSIRLDAERFAALFQAIKELPNLTNRPLTDRGLSRELADQALAAQPGEVTAVLAAFES